MNGIGANLAGGAAGGVAVEIASKVLNKKYVIIHWKLISIIKL